MRTKQNPSKVIVQPTLQRNQIQTNSNNTNSKSKLPPISPRSLGGVNNLPPQELSQGYDVDQRVNNEGNYQNDENINVNSGEHTEESDFYQPREPESNNQSETEQNVTESNITDSTEGASEIFAQKKKTTSPKRRVVKVSERLFPTRLMSRKEERCEEGMDAQKEAEKQALFESALEMLGVLKHRRKEEEACFDFLSMNRAQLRKMNADRVDKLLNEQYKKYLHRRISLKSEPEVELCSKLKANYENKQVLIKNREERNEEYVIQRKRDYAISQDRVKLLVNKLRDEYEDRVQELLRRVEEYREKTVSHDLQMVSDICSSTTDLIISSSIRLREVADAVSFTPVYYSNSLPFFNQIPLHFDQKYPDIPLFESKLYKTQLNRETSRLFVTLLEQFQPESMTPKLIHRISKAICVVMKPLVFNKEQCRSIAAAIGWEPVFVEELEDAPMEVFRILTTNSSNFIVFGFPRSIQEFDELHRLFNPNLKQNIIDNAENNTILPRPIPDDIQPFDLIIELDIDDEIIVRDVLATHQDSESLEIFDIRSILIEDENKVIRIHPIVDPYHDIPQFPSRSVVLKRNFEILEEKFSEKYQRITITSRTVSDDLILKIREYADTITLPPEPFYPSDTMMESLIPQVEVVTPQLREFFVQQWNQIEKAYHDSVHSVFQLINNAHLSMVEHLQKARREMILFLSRPGGSQHLITEFQHWHSTQVERCMRRMQRVKDECTLRLNTLREQLLTIEADRKNEEESKQKDLLNAPFRAALFEVLSNSYVILAQAEVDRWTSTRALLMDFNQIITSSELVPPLQRRKLGIVMETAKTDKKKNPPKKQVKATPANKSRLDGKLPAFELPLLEIIETVKKFISEASCIYIPITAPVSTRNKARQAKDKNPLAIHRINAIEEIQAAFRDDDAYLVSRLDKISQMATDDINSVQQAFDSYIDDSSLWIENHFKRRRAVVDTAVAYMQQKVNEEEQLNQLICFSEEFCTVDYTQLLVPTEESPKIPPAFPAEIIQESVSGLAEPLLQKISQFGVEVDDTSNTD